MDNFIEELREYISDLSDSEDLVAYYKAITMVESLGGHAKKMLQIGILQDKLIELGFEWSGNMQLTHNQYYEVMVEFSLYWVYLCDGSHHESFPYDSPTWQNDLLSIIKERVS